MKILRNTFLLLTAMAISTSLSAQQITTVVDTVKSKYIMPAESQSECVNNLPVQWHKQWLNATGVYNDTSTYQRLIPHKPVVKPITQDTTVHDTLIIVDTIRTMNFTAIPNYVINRKIEIVKGSSVWIREKEYTKQGEYWDTLPALSPDICDSILHLVIIWAENFQQYEQKEICAGNSITWHGRTLTQEGIYWDSLKTVQGGDSVYQLYLHLHYPFAHYDTAVVCQEDTSSFVWRGIHIITPGDYYRTFVDRYGCDSTYHLHMVVPNPTPDTTITHEFCRNQGFEWRGAKYYEQMTFVDSLLNHLGCDSVVQYSFIPRNNDFHSDLVNHYAGEPIIWRGKSYTIDSIYQDTLVNQYGCDSIMELRLVRKYDLDRNIIRCQGDTAMFKKEVIEQNCHRNDTLLTILGGDSIIHYHFSFADPFYAREFVTICSNEYFEWTGHYDKMGRLMVLHEEGIYYDRHRNEAGCDSTYEIQVKHSPAWIKDSIVLICKDSNVIDPVIWYDSKGKKYEFYPYQYLDTTIRDTMHHTLPREPHEAISSEDFVPITGGCDSIFNFRVIITDRCSEIDTIPMCTGPDGEFIPVHVDDKFYFEPGLYSNKLTSYVHQELMMLDSVHNFYIWAAPSDTSYDTVTVCESKLPLVYNNGQKFYNHYSGDYTVMFNNRYGCDSLVYLHINVIPTLYSPWNAYDQYCPGDEIHVETPTGKVFTTTGDFTDTVKYGPCQCDSIILYHIVYKPSFFHSDSVFMRRHDTYTWYGHHNDIVYDSAGVYYDSCKNVYKCDSVYRLRIIYAEPFYKEEEIHTCSNELPYMWHKQTINETGVYWDSCKTIYRLDSVYKATIIVDSAFYDTISKNFCYGDYFELNGKKITTTGKYSYTLRSGTTCDSIITYNVNFSKAMVQYPENVHIAAGTTYKWRGRVLDKQATYFDTIRTKRVYDGAHACDSIIYILHLYVEQPYLNESSVQVCSNELPYIWRKQSLNKPGIYYDSCKTIYGLDSVYSLVLDTLPRYFVTFSQTICQDSSFNFGGEVLTQTGVYVRHTPTVQGCDSAIQCVLTVAPRYYQDEKRSYVDPSELPISWRGKWIDDNQYYYFDTLRATSCNCDSIIYRVHVYRDSAYYFYDSLEICQCCDTPYLWHGRKLYESNTYVMKYPTQSNLDSIYTLKLTVNPSKFERKNVTLCPGTAFTTRTGVRLTEAGVFRDTIYTDKGCFADVEEIIVSSAQMPIIKVSHVICPGQTTYINGQAITQSGTFYDTTQSVITGCDSITMHVVTIGQTFFKDEHATINQGSSYTWHKNGQPVYLTQTGTYFDSCLNQLGCDSIYRLELLVNQAEYNFPTEYANACYDNLPYVWHNMSFYSDTIAQAKYKTIRGLDSIYTLDLTVYYPVDTIIYHNFCDGDVPVFNNQTYTRSGSFTDTLSNRFGCDSLRITHVINFYHKYTLSQRIELKNGECIEFGGDLICTSGTYFHHFTSVHGCDSLVTLHVIACPTVKEITITKNLCAGESFILDGEVITQSCTKYRHLTASDGCDSIVTYVINFNPVINEATERYICQGESVTWRGRVYSKQGLYVDSVLNPSGCYDTYTLRITYKHTDLKDTLISICYNELPYIYKDKKYYVDTVFYDTLPNNIYGCDSIMRWHYSINRHCSDYAQYQRCANETKYIEGVLVDHAGVYKVYRLTPQGEDSIYRFIVHDVQPYEKYTTLAPACDSTTYKGNTFYARGAGRETFQVDLMHRTVDGCDSVEHVTFTINSSSPKYIQYATIADFETYYFEGRTYNTPGTYPVHHLNQHLCDSTRELVLTVLPTTYEDPITYSFCEGDHKGLEIFGKMYFPTKDTLISDTMRLGGQPIIRTAIVTKHLPFIITSFNPDNDQMVCAANKVLFDVSYSVTDYGAKPEYYDVDFFVGDLDAQPKHATYPVNGKTVLPIEMDGRGTSVHPGTYKYQIKFRSESCAYSDTIFTGQVLVRYPAEIMQAYWDNMVTLTEADYNAGHWSLQPPYAWQIWDKDGKNKTALVAPSSNTQPYIASNNLRAGDTIIATLYREDYPLPVPSCPFVFTPAQYTSTDHPVLVYPTVVKKTSSVHIEAEQQGAYRLFNATGSPCAQGVVKEGDNQVVLPAMDGCYLMKVTLQDGSEVLQRVIVY